MVYLMHTVPSCIIMDILEEFDDMSRHTFSEIFTFAPVDVITWHEISLPTCKGGLSLHTTTDHASAAYLASIDGCCQMVSHLCPNYNPVALSEPVHDYNNRTSAMHLSAEGFPYVNTPLIQKEVYAGIEHDILDEVGRCRGREKIDWQDLIVGWNGQFLFFVVPCQFSQVVGEWPENQILIPNWTYFHCPGTTLWMK